MENPQQLALEFLKKNKIGVLATASKDGTPQASLLYYIVDDNFNIYFVTKLETQKAKNIAENNKVAFVVGTKDEPVTVQMYGTAEHFNGPDEASRVNQILQVAHEGNYHWPPIIQIDAGQPATFKISVERVQFYDERTIDLPHNNYAEFTLQPG